MAAKQNLWQNNKKGHHRDRRGLPCFHANLKRHREGTHAAAQERGLFTRLRGDVLNFAPCYVASEAQIDRMVATLGESIHAVLGS